MEQVGIDTLVQTIKDVIEVIPDIQSDLKDGKITWLEGGELVFRHGGKAVRFIANISKLGKELIDLDSGETSEVFDLVSSEFGGTPEAKEALKKIAIGAAGISQGLQTLIENKK